MFKLIGSVVVYGFASYGLVVWLKKKQAENFRQER